MFAAAGRPLQVGGGGEEAGKRWGEVLAGDVALEDQQRSRVAAAAVHHVQLEVTPAAARELVAEHEDCPAAALDALDDVARDQPAAEPVALVQAEPVGGVALQPAHQLARHPVTVGVAVGDERVVVVAPVPVVDLPAVRLAARAQ